MKCRIHQWVVIVPGDLRQIEFCLQCLLRRVRIQGRCRTFSYFYEPSDASRTMKKLFSAVGQEIPEVKKN